MTEKEFLSLLEGFEPIIQMKAHRIQIPGLTPDDIAQEIRMRLWAKRHTFEYKSSFKTWANKVANNCINNLLRHSLTKKESYLNKAISIDELDV